MFQTAEPTQDKDMIQTVFQREPSRRVLFTTGGSFFRFLAVLLTVVSFAVLPGIGYLYYLAGYSATVAFLCLPFIFTAALFGGPLVGIANSVVAILSLLASSVAGGHLGTQNVGSFLGPLLRGAFVFTMTVALATLAHQLKHERQVARTDHLTGVYNRRIFDELLRMEMERSHRYHRTFAVAYLDLDDFKRINDQYGHRIGDEVLQRATAVMRSTLRKTDSIGRLGGDEFGILLPECGEEDVRFVVNKVQERIVEEMVERGWPVGCSVGAVICRGGNWTPSELMETADDLMYTAKRAGKNLAGFSVKE